MKFILPWGRLVYPTLTILSLLTIHLLISLDQFYIQFLPKILSYDVILKTEFPNRSADEIDRLVTSPMELVVSGLPELQSIESTNQVGISSIKLLFSHKANLPLLVEEIYKRIVNLKEHLHPEVKNVQILESQSQEDLVFRAFFPIPKAIGRETLLFWKRKILTELERNPNISSAVWLGGRGKLVLLSLDNALLESKHVTVQTVLQDLDSVGKEIPLGRLAEGKFETLYLQAAEVNDIKELFNIPLNSPTKDTLRLSEISHWEEKEFPSDQLVSLNGKTGMILEVFASQSGNLIQISKQIGTTLKEVEKELPFKVLEDKGEELIEELKLFFTVWLLGIIFIFSYLAFVYRNLKVLLSIFLSLFSAYILLFSIILWFQIPLSILMLGGISIASGFVLDAINLSTSELLRLKKLNKTFIQTSINAIWNSSLSSIVTSVIAILPLCTWDHEFTAYFRDISFGILILLSLSLLVSLYILPIFFYLFWKETNLPRLMFPTVWFPKRFSFPALVLFFVILFLVLAIRESSVFRLFPEQYSNRVFVHLHVEGTSLSGNVSALWRSFLHECKEIDPTSEALVYPERLLDSDSPSIDTKNLYFEIQTKYPDLFVTFFQKRSLPPGWKLDTKAVPSGMYSLLPFPKINTLHFLSENKERLLALQEILETSKWHEKEAYLEHRMEISPFLHWQKKSYLFQDYGYEAFLENQKIISQTHELSIPKIPIPIYLEVTNRSDSPYRFQDVRMDSIDVEYMFNPIQKDSYTHIFKRNRMYEFQWLGLSKSQIDILTILFPDFTQSKLVQEIYDELLKKLILSFGLSVISVYFVLVGIFSSFSLPCRFLMLALGNVFVTCFCLWVFIPNLHFGHALGLLLLFGMSMDCLVLFWEKQNVDKPMDLVWDLFVKNSGTTILGMLACIFFPSEQIGLTIGITVSLTIGLFWAGIHLRFLAPTMLLGANKSCAI